MRIDVLGTSFVVQSDQDPAYLRDVVDYIRVKIKEIQQTVSTTDPLKIAILSSMLITDELLKYKTGQNPPESMEALEASNIAQTLIRTLDATLQEEESSADE